jgi:hypothetical protein
VAFVHLNQPNHPSTLIFKTTLKTDKRAQNMGKTAFLAVF